MVLSIFMNFLSTIRNIQAFCIQEILLKRIYILSQRHNWREEAILKYICQQLVGKYIYSLSGNKGIKFLLTEVLVDERSLLYLTFHEHVITSQKTSYSFKLLPCSVGRGVLLYKIQLISLGRRLILKKSIQKIQAFIFTKPA